MEAISIEPTGEMRIKIKRLSKIRYMATPSLVRKLIDIGIEHELKDYAIGLFRDKKVSLGKTKLSNLFWSVENMMPTRQIQI
ncbi:MAG: hypothetical protein U9N36_08525 [Euryarchaeota archaeon]|nr:hypothetical protein [Euryarchaeota archaeon]